MTLDAWHMLKLGSIDRACIARLLCLFAVWVATVPAFAIEGPPVEQLQEKIQSEIPPYWNVLEVVVVASTNLGDVVEPSIKLRFEAPVVPKVDLFVPDEASMDAFGPFIPVLPTVSSGTQRTLYGIATASYAAGSWSFDVTLENTVDALGQSSDLFDGPTVVRGSEAEAVLRERLRADVAERLKHQLAADLERLIGEHDAALRKLKEEQQAELTSLKAAHEKALAALRLEQEQEIAKLQSTHEFTVAQQTQANQQAPELIESERKKQEFARALTEEIKTTSGAQQAARAAEATALEEERKAAIEASRKEEEYQARRIAELEKTLKGGDAVAAMAAFRTAMQGDDEYLRASARRIGLQGASRPVKDMLLRSILGSSKTLSFLYQKKDRKGTTTDTGVLSLQIDQSTITDDALNFVGQWRGPLFDERYFRDDKVTGSLGGFNLNASSSWCSLFATYKDAATTLEGILQCEKTRGGPATFGVAASVFGPVQ